MNRHAKSLCDLSGRAFGNWKVIDRAPNKTGGRTAWNCACVCGTIKAIASIHLLSGASAGCGCERPSGAENHKFKHGGSSHPLYETWCAIIQRCENPSHHSYKNYGGRGITICPAWRNDFGEFLRAVGERPSPLATLDRKNNSLGYEPGNMRWTTKKVQSRNRRGRVIVAINGAEMPLSEAVERFGGKYSTVLNRLKRGIPIEKALVP